MELAIYFKNGQVAYFTDVRNFNEVAYDEDDASIGSYIEFEYFGLASQRHRYAKFECYSGYSITTD